MLSPATLADRLAVDPRPLQDLKSRAEADEPGALREAARQFEAMLLTTLLRQMRETDWRAPDDHTAQSASLDLYRELLDQQWVQKMVQGRGLGLAERIAEQLTQWRNGARNPTAVTMPAQRQPEPQEADGRRHGAAGVSTNALPVGAGGQPGADGPAGETHQMRFLRTMRPHAETAARATGLPPEFLLAQAALESGWGRREIKAEDGRPSHNLFGIKAGRGWTGPTVEQGTIEYRYGLPIEVRERFRLYEDYAQAFADYAVLLRERYGRAISAGTDPLVFARALAGEGYATDPSYADKLRAVIATVARLRG